MTIIKGKKPPVAPKGVGEPKGTTSTSTGVQALGVSHAAAVNDLLENGFKVEMWPIEKVKRYWNNPRKNSHTVKEIVASLNAFGWQQPIVVDLEGVIIVGDTRYLAGVERGDTHVPVKVADDLTPMQVKSYRLADNKVGESSQWDDAKLTQELMDILTSGEQVDLGSMGFTDDDLAVLEPEKLMKPVDDRYLEDFDVMPAPKPRWILISAPEAAVAPIIKAVEALGYEHLKIESSAYPSSKTKGKLN